MVSQLITTPDNRIDLYAIPLDDDPDGSGKLILYRPRSGMAFVANRAMLDLTLRLLNDGDAGAGESRPVDFLRRTGFLEPDNPPPYPSGEDFSPVTAVLLLTNRCQLRCTYCYASAGDFEARQLTPDLGRAVISRVAENAARLGQGKFRVSFHGGGEPTLAWQTLQECTAFARKMDLPAQISITTNGVWSQRKTAWLTENMDDISLSFDGSPRTQDRNRPYAGGRGSSAALMRTIRTLDQARSRYGIRMTAVAPWSDFPEDVRFICEQTGCPSMQVEPAFNTQRGEHAQPESAEALAFGESFLEALDVAQAAGRSLSFSGARLGQVTTTFCTAPFQALVVNAAAELVACYEVTGDAHPLASLSRIGRIVDGQVQVDLAARNALHARMAERRDACRDCYCYWSCAGDCYTRSFLPGENGHLHFGARCDLNRYLLKEMLLRAIARSGGFWHSTRMGTPARAAVVMPAC